MGCSAYGKNSYLILVRILISSAMIRYNCWRRSKMGRKFRNPDVNTKSREATTENRHSGCKAVDGPPTSPYLLVEDYGWRVLHLRRYE